MWAAIFVNTLARDLYSKNINLVARGSLLNPSSFAKTIAIAGLTKYLQHLSGTPNAVDRPSANDEFLQNPVTCLSSRQTDLQQDTLPDSFFIPKQGAPTLRLARPIAPSRKHSRAATTRETISNASDMQKQSDLFCDAPNEARLGNGNCCLSEDRLLPQLVRAQAGRALKEWSSSAAKPNSAPAFSFRHLCIPVRNDQSMIRQVRRTDIDTSRVQVSAV